MQAKFFTVNTELHSVHTVRPGSKTERIINDAIGTREKLRIKIAGQQHLAFRNSDKALAYLELIRLDGHQG